jgi:sterol 3beta-glucosyltransferase
MKIGMQTWGTHGDIRPIFALAEGLQSSGHQVSLVVTTINGPEYDASVSKTGVKVRSVASPVLHDKSEEARLLEGFREETNSMKQIQIVLSKFFEPAEAEMYRAAEQLCADNDLVVGHYWHYPLQTAAEKAGRHHVSVLLAHALIPSRFQRPVGAHLGIETQFGNQLAWRMARSMLNKYVKPYPDKLRAAQGLAAAGDIIGDVFASHELTLIPVSPQMCQRQKDWPAYYQICGFLDVANLSIEGEVSEGLGQFLSQGEPPVYMTLGSVMPTDAPSQKETVGLLADAARIAGCRAVIQAPLWQECGFEPTSALYYVGASPHSKVFPRCSAVLHHGGAGTSQSATLAGKPSVVVAEGADQEFWGREMQRLGIAPAPLFLKKATARQLSRSIKAAAGSPEMSEKAKKIGSAMAAENGVQTAVKLINERFKK